jgi:CRP/FNR family transcriptional regulator, dissimilatory nitrate respiration regulator
MGRFLLLYYLFPSPPPEQLQLMFDQLSEDLQTAITWQDVNEGHMIFRQGDKADILFFLQKGEVQLLQYTRTGQSVEHYRVHEGEFFAEVVLFLEIYACTAIATQVSEIGAIPKSIFLQVLQNKPELATAVMSQMAKRLHMTKILLELRSIRTARERVLRYFQIMIPLVGEPQASRMEIEGSFKDIAGSLGLSPESFSRALKKLQNENLIARNRYTITLYDT